MASGWYWGRLVVVGGDMHSVNVGNDASPPVPSSEQTAGLFILTTTQTVTLFTTTCELKG